MSKHFTRRRFVRNSVIGLAASSFPVSSAFAQIPLKQRLDWDSFKVSRQYPLFVDAIARMRDNTNASDKRSWGYWVNAHLNYCPHGSPYFLAWHRGYLYYFEQQLRAISGNISLVLPYWNYYNDATIPAEFTDPSGWNPLYQERINTNVSAALTLAPFADGITNMQRGLPNAFEPSMESMPHNPVHNIIGGVMADLLSPTDPIFWLHHANVDRMFVAWAAAGNGRVMPARTDAYWDGDFTYAPKLTLPRRSTFSTRTDLGYFYQDEAMPTLLAATAAVAADTSVLGSGVKTANAIAAKTSNTPPGRPAVKTFAVTTARATGLKSLSIGGVQQIPLDETSITAEIKLEPAAVQTIQTLTAKLDVLPFGGSDDATNPYSAIKVVLNDVRFNGKGGVGGYFYKVYLQLPANAGAAGPEERYLLGNLGPFQISGAKHHAGASDAGVRLEFPATELLKNLPLQSLSPLSVSFVRVSGKSSPQGSVITIGECHVEVSTDVR